MGEDKNVGVPGAQPTAGAGNQMLILLVMMLAMILVFNAELRRALGEILGTVLTPLIGFEGKYLVWTLICASLILVTLSTVSRHFFTDWIAVARTQAMTQNYTKELREARLAGDIDKVKKLIDLQPEVTNATMESTSSQMRTTVFTMIIAIGIFTWLGLFIDHNVVVKAISVPGSDNFILTNKGPLGISPLWIWIYSLFSIPLGQVMQGALKYYAFKNRLEMLESRKGKDESKFEDKLEKKIRKKEISKEKGEEEESEEEIEIIEDEEPEIEESDEEKKKEIKREKKEMVEKNSETKEEGKEESKEKDKNETITENRAEGKKDRKNKDMDKDKIEKDKSDKNKR